MLHRLVSPDPAPAAEAPRNIVSGAPLTQTLNAYESADGLTFSGIWTATVGAWRVNYDEWEYCQILSGQMSLTADSGEVQTFGPGDRFVIEPGFSGVWTVLEDMSKSYVICLPRPTDHA